MGLFGPPSRRDLARREEELKRIGQEASQEKKLLAMRIVHTKQKAELAEAKARKRKARGPGIGIQIGKAIAAGKYIPNTTSNTR